MDDCWIIDLVQRDGWRCLIPGTFKEADLIRAAAEDAAEEAAAEVDEGEDEPSDSEDEGSESESGDSKEGGDEGAAVEPDTSAALLSDETTMTPLANESLRSFFARTVGNSWAPQASEEAHRDGRELDEKELRRRAFALAEMNFESLQRRKQSGDE